MNMTDDFKNVHMQRGTYIKEFFSSTLCSYQSKEGWIDTAVGKELIFSHRDTWYTPKTFPEKFHAHEYYELMFYMNGNVEYINENTLISPSSNMVLWFQPGQMHTARLLDSSRYERYVLYFSPDFFHMDDRITPLIDFMSHSTGTHIILPEKKFDECLNILKKTDNLAHSDKPYGALVSKALLIELFYILDSHEAAIQKGEPFTEAMGEVKRYIDANYVSISSIADIADHFFYSREHLSRKFMQAFNISAANYLSRRRITESLPLLEKMGVTEVAYAVGFHSQSAFINSFKKTMHCLPSEYKLKYKRETAANRQ